MDFDEEFQTYFTIDAHSALIKAVLFRSSSLNHLSNKEILPACILGYYSLFHLGLSLVFLNPEKTASHHDFLVKLKNIRKQGRDPQDNITHGKLINILRDMRFHELSSEIARGKEIREFYNYGPRVTLDEAGNLFFGNPIEIIDSQKITPSDAIDFCKSIDGIIFDQFSHGIESLYKINLYAFSGQLEANTHYLEDESLHLVCLFSKKTIDSAKKTLSELKNIIDLQVASTNSEKL